jgi:5-methylcytosine-specific restriction endonuclease McrA
VLRVAHLGRVIPAKVRTALVERDRCCVVPGCAVDSDLEIDHIRPIAAGGPTELANLCRLCRFHHYLKTHHGWRISRAGKRWLWEGPHGPPPDPDARQPELAAAGP